MIKLIMNNGEENGVDVDELCPWLEMLTPAEIKVAKVSAPSLCITPVTCRLCQVQSLSRLTFPIVTLPGEIPSKTLTSNTSTFTVTPKTQLSPCFTMSRAYIFVTSLGTRTLKRTASRVKFLLDLQSTTFWDGGNTRVRPSQFNSFCNRPNQL